MATVGTHNQAREWARVLASYRQADNRRSLLDLAITIIPLAVLWAAMLVSLTWSYWIALVLAIPTAGFFVRLFMIQHDCGHGAFFRQRRLNDWTGRLIGVLTFTPYDFWRRSHNLHHAGSGNLARRGVGDITTLTTREYQALPAGRRLLYRLYRNPVVMFGLGPTYVFALHHRLPIGDVGSLNAWVSTMTTNAAMVIAIGLMMRLIGPGEFLLVHLPVLLIASTIGVWLFYVQHQSEDTFWANGSVWRQADAALYGSSYYDLPAVMNWMTANIGIHHVHHLRSRIPYYRLSQVLRDHPELGQVGNRLTLTQSLRCGPLVLWDQVGERLITFREMREQQRCCAKAVR